MIAYYRVSTKKQGESGLGLDAQKQIVQHYHGRDLQAEYVEVASGSTLKGRPVLEQAILAALAASCPLVVAKTDRLSRHAFQALEVYERLGGRLVCCDVPNADKCTLTLFFALAERELELIRLRTKQALDRKIAQVGEWRVSQATDAGRAKGVRTNKAKAAENDNNRRALAFLRELIRRNECPTYDCMAWALNNAGFLTSKGKKFTRAQAWRMVRSLEAKDQLASLPR